MLNIPASPAKKKKGEGIIPPTTDLNAPPAAAKPGVSDTRSIGTGPGFLFGAMECCPGPGKINPLPFAHALR